MHRWALALLLVTGAAVADGRAEFAAARDALHKADYEALAIEQRDLLFTRLGSLDSSEVLRPIGEVIALFGDYLDAMEARIATLQEKMRQLNERGKLSEQEIALRSLWERQLQKLDVEWRAGKASLEVLIGVLGKFRERRTIDSALANLGKHPSWRVRYVLAGACGTWHANLRDDDVSKAILALLGRMKSDAEPRVRSGVARGLGSIRRQEALEVLGLYLKDPDWRVRAAAIQSLSQTRSPEVVTMLIEALKAEDGRLRDDINAVLLEMTGQNMGYADVWERWWTAVGRKLPEEGSAAEGTPEAPVYKDGHRFYGIQSRSNRIVFVVDVSGSMNQPVDPVKQKPVVTGKAQEAEGPAPGRTRLEVAANELRRAVDKLSPQADFTIIFFSHSPWIWKRDLVKATPEAKKEAHKAIDGMRGIGATFTLGALREAFTMAGALGSQQKTGKTGGKVDTIFLLSDGAPTDNKFDGAELMDPGIIIESVREWNKDLHVVIHCIAVDLPDNGFLRTLASENGGQFVERKG
jgi:hypothetical protein